MDNLDARHFVAEVASPASGGSAMATAIPERLGQPQGGYCAIMTSPGGLQPTAQIFSITLLLPQKLGRQ